MCVVVPLFDPDLFVGLSLILSNFPVNSVMGMCLTAHNDCSGEM